MKVYLVYWCNNEPYEDYRETVEAVCATRDLAERFIFSKGYHPREFKFIREYDSQPNERGDYHSMWIREMEVIEVRTREMEFDE